jgi:hypothetical protein
MIGLASDWLAIGSIPFALSGGELVALSLIAALRFTPLRVELRISSLLSLRLQTEPTREGAHTHRATSSRERTQVR